MAGGWRQAASAHDRRTEQMKRPRRSANLGAAITPASVAAREEGVGCSVLSQVQYGSTLCSAMLPPEEAPGAANEAGWEWATGRTRMYTLTRDSSAASPAAAALDGDAEALASAAFASFGLPLGEPLDGFFAGAGVAMWPRSLLRQPSPAGRQRVSSLAWQSSETRRLKDR